jgi:hypothetical protein
LQNKHARLTINRRDLSLQQIRDLVRGEDYVKESGGSLFLVALWDPKYPTEKMLDYPQYRTSVDPALCIDGMKAKAYECLKTLKPDGTAELKLKYLENSVASKTGTVDVTVTVSLANKSGQFEWGIAVDNASGLHLYEVHFRLQGLASSVPGSENTDFLAVPASSGQKCSSPRTMGVFYGFYPNCLSMQLASYCDGKGGSLYLASHDAKAYHKDFMSESCSSKQAFTLTIKHYADQPGLGKWQLPYSVFFGPIEGDWYDAAKIYRTKFANKVWKPLSERTDIAPWFRDLSVWMQGGAATLTPTAIVTDENDMLAFADRMVKLRNMLGEDIGVHCYIWHKHIIFDNFYPDYLPARPGFKEATERMAKAGVYCTPYVNMHLFDQRLPMFENGDAKRSIIKALVPGKENMYYVDKLYPMCFGTAYWRDKIVGIERDILRDYQVGALYLDELNSLPEICYATDHEHPAHGGDYYAEGEHKILREVRALKEWGNRPPVITGENLSEAHMAYCDGLITGHSDVRPDSPPIFQAVHSDHTTEIGIYLYPDEVRDMNVFMAKLGFNLVRGRQLGWFNTLFISKEMDFTSPELSPQLARLRELCKVRRAGQEFLFFGEFLRTPDLSALPHSEVEWYLWTGPFVDKENPNYKMTARLPTVLAECYRSPAGNIGIVLVNRTNKTQEVSIPWNAKDWYLKPGKKAFRQDYVNGQWTDPKAMMIGTPLGISLPAYTSALIKVTNYAHTKK